MALVVGALVLLAEVLVLPHLLILAVAEVAEKALRLFLVLLVVAALSLFVLHAP